MSLEFFAILPHSPILIPSIGKDNTNLLKKTIASYQKIKDIIKMTEIDTVVILSPHGENNEVSFILNLGNEYTINFEIFGDFSINQKVKGNISLSHRIKERLETKTNFHLNSVSVLDHGTAIPSYLLLEPNSKTKLIPIYSSNNSLLNHFNFGKLLQRELIFTNEKIGVIASGDLSHKITKNSPHGFSAKAKKFDSKIIDLLKNNKSQEILEISEKLMLNVEECGLRPISILLGMLDGISHKSKLLSYEHPFGIGYLSFQYLL